MATLVLSTVGTIFGGPLGGAIGSLIGQSIDQQLFGPGPRQGPRLGDLSIQTSSYGTPVPRIYGTMRVAGTVVWATDLKEDRENLSGGKGQPETINYRYSASFAVALSSRRAVRVKRIWADGKILRGAAGDFKTGTIFRFYPGDEKQAVDPLIASIEGDTPAFRGLALAVFENLQLADFGNRIPMLTFEIEADAAPPTLAALLSDASGGAIACTALQVVGGYAAHGADVRGAIEPLVESFGLDLFDDGASIRSPGAAAPALLVENMLGCSAQADRVARVERKIVATQELPAVLTLNYYDPERDYQSGQMRASAGTSGQRQRQIDFPAVVAAGVAKALVQGALARQWAQRERVTLRLSPEHLDLVPGDSVRLPGEAQNWRVERAMVEQMVIVAELKRIGRESAALPAEPGRAVGSYDALAAPTRIALFDFPGLGTTVQTGPTLHLAAASGAREWRPVPIEISVGGVISSSQTAIGETVMGTTIGTLANGQGALLDLLASVEVELVGDAMWLENCDDAALVSGSNLAVLGNELVQYGRAVPSGPKRFLLSRLVRGRRGTEWAMSGHVPGEIFALIKSAALRPIGLGQESLGAVVSVRALGIGDVGAPLVVSRSASGEALRPPSPVHLRAARRSDAGLDILWVRRSRAGWGWLDAIDAPIGEAIERYRINITGTAGALELESGTTAVSLNAAQVSALGSGATGIAVAQLGDYALSRAAMSTIILA